MRDVISDNIEDEINQYLRNVGFEKPIVVNSRSNNSDDWDSWGVRDIAPLADAKGSFIYKDDGSLDFYYTGSSYNSLGGYQRIGKGSILKSGEVILYQNNPILKCKSKWYDEVCSTPFVIKESDEYRMYFKGAMRVGEDDSLGVAVSKDGVNFIQTEDKPILSTKDFKGMCEFPSLMGVTNIVKGYSGEYILSFEAYEKGTINASIFGAISLDGFDFKPMNNGYPIFKAGNVKNWPVKHVANPRIILLDEGWYMLSFNGTIHSDYSLGVAFTKDFCNWYEHKQNPLIIPRAWPKDDPFTYRLEGACFDREAILSRARKVTCYFMSIPIGSRNHENGVNAKIDFCVDGQVFPMSVKAFPTNEKSVKAEGKVIVLDSSLEKSGYIQAHIINDGMCEYRINVGMIEKGTTYIALSDSFSSISCGMGLIVKIEKTKAYVRVPIYDYPCLSFDCNFPRDKWRLVHELEVSQNFFTVSLTYNESVSEYTVCIDGHCLNISSINDFCYRILTVAAYKCKVTLNIDSLGQ